MAISQEQIHAYARHLLHQGVRLQPGQPLYIRAELAHREFVHQITEVAYRQFGARYVDVGWTDTQLTRTRIEQSHRDHLDYAPDYVTAKGQELVDAGYAYLAFTGSEFPDIFADVDAEALQRVQTAVRQKQRPWRARVMANEIAWCVAGVPTLAWARKVFPEASAGDAVDQLWRAIFAATRADQSNPDAAWQAHLQKLDSVVDFLHNHEVRSLHFFDPAPGRDGAPRTDLHVGLTEAPVWTAGQSERPGGVAFSPNIPTEEVFTTPHRARVNGYVRTSMPFYVLNRQVQEAFFRFENGELVDFDSTDGADVLNQFFGVEGTRHMGEVALVDAGSPIFQSGLLFHETLFDENAACHVAFGKGYPFGLRGGTGMSDGQLLDAGVNDSPLHQDVMIGTETLNLTASTAGGTDIQIMESGRYTGEVVGRS